MLTRLLTLALCLCLTWCVSARPHRHVSHGVHPSANATSLAQVRKILYPDVGEIIDASNVDRFFSLYNSYVESPVPNGVFGVDVSSWLGQDTWTCLKNAAYTVAIVREWESICQADPNGVHTVANAWAAGIDHVDIYLFPDYGCGNGPAWQVQQTIASMGTIPFGTLWFDIETAGSGWSGNPDDNHTWLVQAIAQANSMIGSSRVGIYSSKYAWGVVMGGYSDLAGYPMWYAHYDNNPSFSDWEPFNGWASPAMKQFEGDASECGADVDLNWYP